MWPFSRPSDAPAPQAERQRSSIFDALPSGRPRWALEQAVTAANVQRDPPAPQMPDGSAVAMDESIQEVKARMAAGSRYGGIPEAQLQWYATFGFVGWQTCAILAQHWLIDKACAMPGRDAVRSGWEITINDGSEVAPEVLDAIRDADDRYNVPKNLVEFAHMGRVFGIRIAMFVIDNPDPLYYEHPYNPDGIAPGSYRGITQIDPYWISPVLDMDASANPASIHFYEPTWWIINGQRVHRSHLIIYRPNPVPDILKPTYLYGGVPVTQQIAERVFAAERSANEAPLLALTKRTKVYKTAGVSEAIANQGQIEDKLGTLASIQNNFGVWLVDDQDAVEQLDTALSDLDALIMTQYQLVAAAARVPATKLLGTAPKGFNATGEYDEAAYHEELESLQTHDLAPLLDRHHEILMRSEIAPRFGLDAGTRIRVKWHELDALTSQEMATINQTKAQTAVALAQIGAIDGADERARLVADPDSGYSGLADLLPEDEPLEELGEGLSVGP